MFAIFLGILEWGMGVEGVKSCSTSSSYSQTGFHMPHPIKILSSLLVHVFLALSFTYNEWTQGTCSDFLNWSSSGQIMIVNRNKPNHLSQSLISPVLPRFLLLVVLTADDKMLLPKPPPHRKTNPNWDPDPSTWGCGSAGSTQWFCQP